MRKHALIVGASGAIGQQITRDLSESGYSFSLHYNKNTEALKQLVRSLPDESVYEMIQGDLSNTQGIADFLEKIQFTPEVIVFSQGQASYGLFYDLSSVDMAALLSVHVEALWKITQHFLPKMIQQQAGNIIVISSIWGKCGASYEVAYSTVKGAQIAFVKALAKEMGPSGIRINAVTPGFIDTNMNSTITTAERTAILEDIPLQRLGKVEDVSNLCEFLVSDRSGYMTGEIINVSGGWYI